eukprot:TRINITY_DN79860_c0_g1_i1.p1 TRINITY_DN79860_c0_g1~~TRINITY_DN79860_c0_g1_i1.p1  ORF type:complete len:133 (+),score=34.21 TRINITY_DN79860_c0_g1_i1:97-495(+)
MAVDDEEENDGAFSDVSDNGAEKSAPSKNGPVRYGAEWEKMKKEHKEKKLAEELEKKRIASEALQRRKAEIAREKAERHAVGDFSSDDESDGGFSDVSNENEPKEGKDGDDGDLPFARANTMCCIKKAEKSA